MRTKTQEALKANICPRCEKHFSKSVFVTPDDVLKCRCGFHIPLSRYRAAIADRVILDDTNDEDIDYEPRRRNAPKKDSPDDDPEGYAGDQSKAPTLLNAEGES